jgi:hypothetical protein
MSRDTNPSAQTPEGIWRRRVREREVNGGSGAGEGASCLRDAKLETNAQDERSPIAVESPRPDEKGLNHGARIPPRCGERGPAKPLAMG